jgi:hypothetical protein
MVPIDWQLLRVDCLRGPVKQMAALPLMRHCGRSLGEALGRSSTEEFVNVNLRFTQDAT